MHALEVDGVAELQTCCLSAFTHDSLAPEPAQGTLHLGQGPETPRSNRAAALEDEIDRLKMEHRAKLLEAEEASKARQDELAQSVELLQKKALKLQNQALTLETSLVHAKGTLAAERDRWEDERAQLLNENSRLHEQVARLREQSGNTSNANQCTLQHYESDLQRLRNELSELSTREAEVQRASQSAVDRAARLESEADKHMQDLTSHRAEIDSLSRQIACAREREAALAQELVGFRERNSELQSKLSLLHLQSTASQQYQQQFAEVASKLSRAEEKNDALSRENRTLLDQLTRLHAQLAEYTKTSSQSTSSGGTFAVHVKLKRENQQLKAQVEELKQLQKRFLTTAKKKTMSFPAI